MLNTALLQPCRQSQSNRAVASKVNPNLHINKQHKANTAEGRSDLEKLQGTEDNRSHGEQEWKEFRRENHQEAPWRSNGNVLPCQSNGSRLAPDVTQESLWPISDMLGAGTSNRGDQSQEWKVVKVKRVLVSPVGEPRKTNISRRASLSETELKEAKARSQRIVAQLTTPPSSNSKGVLLFHRRRQRVNAFTLETPEATGQEQAAAALVHHHIPSHGKESNLEQPLQLNGELKTSLGIKMFRHSGQKVTMEKYEERLSVEQALNNTQGIPWNKGKGEEILHSTNPTVSSKDILDEELQQIPLSVYLKQNTGTLSTNGMHESVTKFEKVPISEQGAIMGNSENIPPKADDVSTNNREESSTTLAKDLYLLRIDQENNIFDEEPYLPIGSENNNISDKKLHAAVVDKENNIVLSQTLNEPVMNSKENGEIFCKEPDELIIGSKNIADTEKPILVTDIHSNETSTQNNKHYSEVRLTLSKPQPVKNRTARPFGTQTPATSLSPAKESPVVEVPPPPTYAETFSSPPPVTRVRSPPAYSALYPSEEQKILVPPKARYGNSRPGPQNIEPPPGKIGILEESSARRAAKKSMFTFVEKPKVTPNPDLLNLVQTADNKKKQKEQGGAIPEDESFALGADASNFLAERRSLEGPTEPLAESLPEWSSCLRSPRISPKPKISSNQSLSEAKGKGAELFARRQSRMQKYIIEAPSHPDIVRSPSPTMSLPPSWKYTSETNLSPLPFQPALKSPLRSPKHTSVPLYNSNVSESEVSRKELEMSKQQPYQLQSSLFILSPAKEPMRSLPKAAPPSKPVVPEPSNMRQAFSSTSPLPPSPVLHPPAQSSPGRPQPGLYAPSSGTVFPTQKIRASPEASPEASVEYSSIILSPRAKGIFQAPRPSYSTKNAGIEPQERRPSLPVSPPWTPQLMRRQPSSLEGWMSPAQTPEPEEGLEASRAASVMTPPPPMSPSWSERSLSPFRQENDPKSSRQMQLLLARNIINAARRKSSSPKATGVENFRPFTPPVSYAMVSSTGGSPKNVSSPSPLQSPKPTQMDGHRRVSLPVSTALSQVSASSNNSPRLRGRKSPTFKSPLQSPKGVRMNGNKYFILPTKTGASQFYAPATHNGPSTMGTHPEAHKDTEHSPKPTVMNSHRIVTLPSNASSPKNLDASSPTIQSPLPSPVMRAGSPIKRYTSMSPTNSDASVDSEYSGIKSSSICSFNICPRGWNGSMRLKRGSVPSEASCTS